MRSKSDNERCLIGNHVPGFGLQAQRMGDVARDQLGKEDNAIDPDHRQNPPGDIWRLVMLARVVVRVTLDVLLAVDVVHEFQTVRGVDETVVGLHAVRFGTTKLFARRSLAIICKHVNGY
jgi:hypothetical protein